MLMLARTSIITEEDARKITGQLLAYLELAQAGKFVLKREFEDVHLNVERRLMDDIGSCGGRLHTARSRNDQVVTDSRIYMRGEIVYLIREIQGFVGELLKRADEEVETVMLGYTHSQPAQPISYGFWISCYASMLLRDTKRLAAAYSEVNMSPLGACALGGTSFPIDRQLTARMLGFDSVLLHALDATSTRDFFMTTLSALAILGADLSRFSEELVWWSGHEYGLLTIDDAFATGSSIMPQKKNPVVAELARARCAVAMSALQEMFLIAKGVPLGYSCDLQQDKPPMWRALDGTVATVSILRAQFSSMRFDHERGEQLCWETFSTATELANYLTEELGLPFRTAYSDVGTIVKALEFEGKSFRDSDRVAEMLAKEGIEFNPETLAHLIDPRVVLRKQRSQGSTGPTATRAMLEEFRARLSDDIRENDTRQQKLSAALASTLRVARQFTGGADLRMLIHDSMEMQR